MTSPTRPTVDQDYRQPSSTRQDHVVLPANPVIYRAGESVALPALGFEFLLERVDTLGGLLDLEVVGLLKIRQLLSNRLYLTLYLFDTGHEIQELFLFGLDFLGRGLYLPLSGTQLFFRAYPGKAGPAGVELFTLVVDRTLDESAFGDKLFAGVGKFLEARVARGQGSLAFVQVRFETLNFPFLLEKSKIYGLKLVKRL